MPKAAKRRKEMKKIFSEALREVMPDIIRGALDAYFQSNGKKVKAVNATVTAPSSNGKGHAGRTPRRKAPQPAK